jgi:hypothetical protein
MNDLDAITPVMRVPHLRDKVLLDTVAEMLLFIRQEKEDDPSLPDIQEIVIKREDRDVTYLWNHDSWIVYAVMKGGRTYKYAWYVDAEGVVVADGF